MAVAVAIAQAKGGVTGGDRNSITAFPGIAALSASITEKEAIAQSQEVIIVALNLLTKGTHSRRSAVIQDELGPGKGGGFNDVHF